MFSSIECGVTMIEVRKEESGMELREYVKEEE